MRLIIGIAVFIAWSAGSGYWYVCKIKGLCPDNVSASGIAADAPLAKSGAIELDTAKTVPEDLPPPQPMEIPQDLRDTQSLLFSFAKPILKNRTDMDGYIENAANFLLRSSDHKVVITGYTDDTAARHNNLKLGMRRAEVVADMFRNAGIPDTQMVIESKGEQDPVASNMTRAGREKNRRVEIGIILE